MRNSVATILIFVFSVNFLIAQSVQNERLQQKLVALNNWYDSDSLCVRFKQTITDNNGVEIVNHESFILKSKNIVCQKNYGLTVYQDTNYLIIVNDLEQTIWVQQPDVKNVSTIQSPVLDSSFFYNPYLKSVLFTDSNTVKVEFTDKFHTVYTITFTKDNKLKSILKSQKGNQIALENWEFTEFSNQLSTKFNFTINNIIFWDADHGKWRPKKDYQNYTIQQIENK